MAANATLPDYLGVGWEGFRLHCLYQPMVLAKVMLLLIIMAIVGMATKKYIFLQKKMG